MRRYLALGGIAGPALFASVLLIAGSLSAGYDHAGQMISELGASGASNAWLMNYAGFIASGLLISLFGISLFTLPRSVSALLGAALVVVFGLGTLAAGVVSCDPGCVSVAPSPEQMLHEQVSQVAFSSLILAALVWGGHSLRDERGRAFGAYSLLTGVVAIALLIAFIGSIEGGGQVGLLQRALVAVLFVWLAEFARRVRGDKARSAGRFWRNE